MEWKITLDSTADEQLSRLMALTNRNGQQLLENMVTDALARKAEKISAMEEGLEDLRAGRIVGHDEAMRLAEEAIRSAASQK